VDSDIIKAIMFTEMPMNIRGDIWSDFQGKHYDTRNPEQNIELATLLVKQIYKSIDNPTPEKVITIWNSAGRNSISSFGYRGALAYRKKLWL